VAYNGPKWTLPALSHIRKSDKQRAKVVLEKTIPPLQAAYDKLQAQGIEKPTLGWFQANVSDDPQFLRSVFNEHELAAGSMAATTTANVKYWLDWYEGALYQINQHLKSRVYDEDGFDQDGYDEDGFDEDGYDSEGYNEDGYDEYGRDAEGYDEYGYDSEGYDREGYNSEGYDENGYDGDGFDADGRNEEGYDRNGYDEEGYDSDGLDADGVSREVAEIGDAPRDTSDENEMWDYAQSEHLQIRELLAQNTELPADVIDELLKDATSVRVQLARNSEIPVNYLSLLAKDEVPRVRSSVAKNKATPAGVLTSLARDPDFQVVEAVGGNRNTPKKTLSELVGHDNLKVWEAVAENVRTTPADMQRLYDIYSNNNQSVDFKRAFTKNWKTPAPILSDLFKEANSKLQAGGSFDNATWENLAGNVSLPREDLSQLYSTAMTKMTGYPSEYYRIHILEKLAKNTSVEPDLLGRIMQSAPNTSVRTKAAENPSIDPAYLDQALGGDYWYDVAKSPVATPEQLAIVYEKAKTTKNAIAFIGLADNPNSGDELLNQIVRELDPNYQGSINMLTKIAENPHAGPDTLVKIYRRAPKSEGVLLALCGNRNMPADYLEEIVEENAHLKTRLLAALVKNPNLRGDLRNQVGEWVKGHRAQYQGKDLQVPEHAVADGALVGKQFETLTWLRNLAREAGGTLMWRDFLTTYPQYENNPAIRKVFFSQQVRNEQGKVIEAISVPFMETLIAKERQVSQQHALGVDAWGGIQRHFEDRHNLVIQLNLSQEFLNTLKQDPEYHAWYVETTADMLAVNHPVLPYPGETIGWARISEIRGEGELGKAWLIEEVQSDLDSAVQGLNYKMMPDILDKQEVGRPLEKKQEQWAKYAPRLKNDLKDWERILMSSVLETARKSGVHDVYMLTPEAKSENGTNSMKLNKFYSDLPAEYRFEKVQENFGKGEETYWHRLATKTPATFKERVARLALTKIS
jgi:hypothetical protein